MTESKRFGECLPEVSELKLRIEHQSLILAQDERWRRAYHRQVERGSETEGFGRKVQILAADG